MSLSVVIPTLNAAHMLSTTLKALGPVDEVIVIDGGSSDATLDVARACGAHTAEAPQGRGFQLSAGAAAAQYEWLLFLHADTVLEPGWKAEAQSFMSDPENQQRAAVFRFKLDDGSLNARRLERFVAWRTRFIGLPYGDQGLLISSHFYRALGGFREWPLMEDVDLVRRIGRRRIVPMKSYAQTSAQRWRREGWGRRSLRNGACLMLYFLGLPPRVILRLYR